MTGNNGLKDREELFNELDALFSDKEELIAEGWYSLPEFEEAIFEVIENHIEGAESEWKIWQPFLRGRLSQSFNKKI